jgi:hypothetical protein
MISQIFGTIMLIYLLVAILFLMAELWSSDRLQAAGRIMLWLGLGIQTGALLGRWWESYHLALGHSPTAGLAEKLQLIIIQVPLSNFYESLIFFAWCLPGLSLLAFRRYLKGYLGALVAILLKEPDGPADTEAARRWLAVHRSLLARAYPAAGISAAVRPTSVVLELFAPPPSAPGVRRLLPVMVGGRPAIVVLP